MGNNDDLLAAFAAVRIAMKRARLDPDNEAHLTAMLLSCQKLAAEQGSANLERAAALTKWHVDRNEAMEVSENHPEMALRLGTRARPDEVKPSLFDHSSQVQRGSQGYRSIAEGYRQNEIKREMAQLEKDVENAEQGDHIFDAVLSGDGSLE